MRQAKLARSSRCKSGPGKGQRPPGNECCAVEGDDTCEASNKTDYKSAAERVEGRRPVGGKASSDACPGLRAGPGMSLKRRAYGLEVHGLPSSYPRSRLTFDESPLRESCTVGSVGEVPGNWHLYPTSASAPSRALAFARVSAKRR